MKRRGARLGQHFLTGQWAARTLAAAGHIKRNEPVLEIGPGTGALTKELLAAGGRVLAIEKDEALVAQLEETFAGKIASGALRVVAADIRDVHPEHFGLSSGGYVLAANIPYYITGEIIRKFLETKAQPRALVLLVQKEVAERVLARDKKESVLSLSVKAYGVPRIVAKVTRGNFSPPPSVDSAILLVDDVSKTFFGSLHEHDFFSVVRAGFSSKRKYLANNLSTKYGKGRTLEAMQECGIDAKARAEDVPLETWGRLARRLTAAK